MLYKVKATYKKDTLKAFFTALTDGSISALEPDGPTMVNAMQKAKMIDNDTIVWYEECYCASPLKHERETVYDFYLTGFETELVKEVSDDIKGDLFWEYLEDLFYEEIYSY